MHQNALPTLAEMEGLPGLREAVPGWNVNSPLTKPKVTKGVSQKPLKNNPTQAMKMRMEDKARVVMK